MNRGARPVRRDAPFVPTTLAVGGADGDEVVAVRIEVGLFGAVSALVA